MRRSLWRRSDDGLPPRYRQSDGIAQAAHAGHVVVLDPFGAKYFGFDEVGARIWELLQSAVTPDDIADHIAREYDAPRDTIKVDVDAFIGQLAQARLITAEKYA
jgi:Coenzyme PQQ synthesis protein D (PqqD)